MITRTFAALLMGATLLAGPVIAHDHGNHDQNTQDASMQSSDIDRVIASDIRAEDRLRDEFRNPGETLTFFGITSDMAVGEYSPGGGWYTRILAPLVIDNGRYVAINADVERYLANADEDRLARAKSFPDTFPQRAAEFTGLEAGDITAIEIDEAPQDMLGTLDAVLTFRSFHGLESRGMAVDTARQFADLLKPGGIVGVVQHRAPEDAPAEYVDGSNGYLKQSRVIEIFTEAGFELVDTSEVNANPSDTADHEGGVWSLPPRLRHGDTDREKYEAIGESDRMTLLFRKMG